MFCPHCGENNPFDAKYCKNCGTNLNTNIRVEQPIPNSTIVYTIPHKSVGVGIGLTFQRKGLGHLYAGLIGKGLGLLILYIVLWVISPAIYFTYIVAFILWIWALFDVRNTINEYNDYTRNTGRPPW